MPIRMTTIAAGACLVLCASIANAQSRTGTTGSTGSAGGVSQAQATRPTSFGNAASGATTGGAAAGAATGAAAGATPGSGRSGGNAQMSTSNQPQFDFSNGSVGDQIGQNAFAGQGNTGFTGTRNAGQNAGTSLTPQFNQMNDSNSQNNRGNSGNANVKRARPQQRIAFTYPKANLAKTRIEISARFKRLATVSGADTTISDAGVATLTGTVTDDDSRKLAEALTRLEPGVRSVVNELRVETATP